MFRGGAFSQGGESTYACAPVIGRLNAIVGSVAITRTTESIAGAVIGDVIYEGDEIDTGVDGLAVILFVDGTILQLDAGTHFTVAEFPRGAESTSDSALFRIIRGAFRFIGGRRANGPVIDTPFGSVRSHGRAVGLGSLALSVLTFGLVSELKAGSTDLSLLDDETITYKDLKHGVFVVVTKEANPRVIVVDDPGVSVTLRRDGAAVSVQSIANSPAQMAQLQAAYNEVASTYSQGRQDPFIQQFQQFQQGTNPNDHANADPQSAPGSTGSSTPLNELNLSPQLLQENGNVQLASVVQESLFPVVVNAVGVGSATTNSALVSPIPVEPASTSTTVNWVSMSSGNWDIGLNWNTDFAPPSLDTVVINLPVTVTINAPEAIAALRSAKAPSSTSSQVVLSSFQAETL
jgi:hypothetical protein